MQCQRLQPFIFASNNININCHAKMRLKATFEYCHFFYDSLQHVIFRLSIIRIIEYISLFARLWVIYYHTVRTKKKRLLLAIFNRSENLQLFTLKC